MSEIFKAYDVRAVYPNPLNEETAWKIGNSAARYLLSGAAGRDAKLADTIVVGRDMRPSSPSLAKSLIDGILAAGANVIDIGMIDTSMIYFAINHLDAIGGIQTTASHNPIQYNGFKISGAKARPIGSDTGLKEIEKLTQSPASPAPHTGRTTQQDLWPDYRRHVLRFLKLARPIRVAIDAGNGMAGKMVPAVFGNLPDLHIVPVLFDITGSFTHDPNPLVEANLQILRDKMAAEKPDLGVCFDGDADRCVILDENGQTVGGDLVVALMAADDLHKPENRGAAVVYDLRSSKVVAEEVTAAGGVPRRSRVGHVFLKKAMADHRAIGGGELSGHFYFRDNFNADSGAIAFARVLSILSATTGKMSQLVRPLRRYSQTGEINFRVPDKQAKIDELARAYPKAKIDHLDGITIDNGDWWFNVRQSNTESLLRLNLEAKTPDQMKAKFAEVQRILGEPLVGH